MGSKYYSSLLRLYYLQSLEKLPVNTTVAFSGFTTCNLWKKMASKYYSSLLSLKMASKYYSSLLRLYYLQSLEKKASKL